ncbi:hypothetical protein BH10ACI3_BH10ACI3_20230 [soil metagenome]
MKMIKHIASTVFLAVFVFLTALMANAQFVDTTRINNGAIVTDEWATQVLSTPSGKEIISAGVDGRVVFWDGSTGKALREVKLATIVLTLSLTKDGQTLAVGDATGTVTVIDAASGAKKASFTADKKIVNASAWSEDGKFLASGGAEVIVRIWSADDRKVTKEITPAKANITALAFTGSRLVIGLLDGKIEKRSAEVWDWQASKMVRTYDEGPAGVRAIGVSPDGKLLAIADFQKATLVNMIPTEGNGAEISLRVLPDNDKPTIVAIWDLTTGKRVSLVEAETGARTVAFSPDGQLLVTGGVNGAMIFDVGNGLFTEVGRIDSQTGVDSVAFSGDSKQLFLAREREPLVKFGDGGIDKVIDPFFTSMIMQVREGFNSGVLIDAGATEVTPKDSKPKAMGAPSLTGGSSIETWQITRRTAEPDAKTFAAVKLIFNGKPEDSRKMLQQVIKDFPHYGDAQRLYAVFFESKDVKKVQALLEASVKSDANCVACWRSLGDVQYGTEHAADAVTSYDQALKLKPEYGLVSGHLADALGAVAAELIKTENTEKTMDGVKVLLIRAAKLRPGVPEFYSNLAAAYYFRGDFDTDINLLIIARKLRPDHARIYYNLGHAYRYKGEKQNAIEAYKRYVQMGEKGEEARVEKAKDFISELSK